MTPAQMKGIYRQGMRYAIAAKQDRLLVIRHLHLNYAVGALQLLLGMTSDAERAAAGISGVRRDLGQLRKAQDLVQAKLLVQQGAIAL